MISKLLGWRQSILALTLISSTSFGAAVIFSGNNVKALKQNLDLNGVITLQSGGIDPSSSSTSGNAGSLYCSTAQTACYVKQDAGASTNWSKLSSGTFTLNSQTGSTQVFANDTNFGITSSANTHTLGWNGVLSIARGGTNNGSLATVLGGVVYTDATKLNTLVAGTSGQALMSNGASAPTWGNFIKSDGSITFTGNQSMGGFALQSLLSPVNANDAASKSYVDNQLNQLNPAAAVYAASTANIGGTYTNAVSGVCIGDTFTTTATTAFALDGVSPALNSRVLFKDQTNSFQDGVWTLTTQAVGGVSGAILTRALDFDSSADINAGQIVPVSNGTANAGSSWFQTATNTTCNTSTQTWTQFQKASSAYLQSLNGQTNSTQVFANDTNIGITSSANTHTLGWNGQLSLSRGGTNAQLTAISGGVVFSTSTGLSILSAGTSGQILTSGGAFAPTWAAAGAGTSPTANYFSGTMPHATTWSPSSTGYADPTNSGNNTLTTIYSHGLTVTAAASNLPGITITPSATTDTYIVTAIFVYGSGGGGTPSAGAYRLYDGTNELCSGDQSGASDRVVTLSCIWNPNSTSASTVKIQIASPSSATNGLLNLQNTTLTPSITWSLVQIR